MAAARTAIRAATVRDIPGIHALISRYARRELMLARPLGELYENVRDFFVVRRKGDVVACAALHVVWGDLAEIKSLAVAPELEGQGLGKRLVRACLRAAPALGVKSVFVLTYLPDFFAKHGFGLVGKEKLPHKVWQECLRCAKFPDCTEVALLREL
jgi:amino-acid N-acetyltransferase